jgi:predicted esterase
MLLATLALVAAAQSLPALPRSEASALSKGLAQALADPEGKLPPKLSAAAKQWGSKYDAESLIAALRAGPELDEGDPKPRGKGKNAEKIERFGSVLYGFTFSVDGDAYRYGVDVPSRYEPRRPAPVLLDPGHGAGAKQDARGKAGYLEFFRGQADMAGLEDALVVRTEIVEQIGAGGLRGAKPEDQVARVFDAFFRDLGSRFAIDLDRVWVTGLSQTGFWSWQLGIERADRFAGIAPMGAVTWQTKGRLANLSRLSVLALHGESDAICPVAQPRATTKELEQLGVRVRYVEVPGAGHDVAVWGKLHESLGWLAEVPRDPYPKAIAKHVQTLAQPWCYWARLDELAREGPGVAGQPPTASLEARIEGQRVTITSKGVTKVTLGLARELVDLSKPVTVTWNGREAFEGAPKRDFARSIAVAVDKGDWRGTFEAFVELQGGK